MTLAALDTVLTFYENPERLAEEVPSIRLLSRTQDDIHMQAQSVANALRPDTCRTPRYRRH